MAKFNRILFFGWLVIMSGVLTSHTSQEGVITPVKPDNTDTALQKFVRVLDIQIDSNTFYKNIDFQFVYTSFFLEMKPEVSLANAFYVEQNGTKHSLDSLPLSDQPEEVVRSPFVIPSTTQGKFNLYSGDLHGTIRIHFFYTPPLAANYKSKLKKASSMCDKPEMVSGKIWREGLPAPIGTRENHVVHHLIVHHSASSNSNTDYINVVRNIYLLHTQSNGWDDIGYNFLVAQDGTIFEGRDNQGIDSSDNIKGAHFCGKNDNTMGICLLGNYEKQAPSEATIQSLKSLLVWKCFKEDLDALGESRHPAGGNFLEHIAGHRDGCATACPGDSVYTLLPKLRSEVNQSVEDCKGELSNLTVSQRKKTYWYQDQNTELLTIVFPTTKTYTQIALYSSDGRLIDQTIQNDGLKSYTYSHKLSGFYYVQVIDEQHGTEVFKVYLK